MRLNIEFTEGKYNNTTINILRRNPIIEKDSELPIVGGTGIFKMACGVVAGNTYLFNVDTNYSVLQYTLALFTLIYKPI
ncbi:UNVERIFIED_CONTAM: Dirigent protein 19 [Sesamum indicum]